MKFICDQCSTKYSIADEKVRRKVLKIRCKNCGNIIVVRDPTRASGALTAVATEGSRALDQAFQQVFSEPTPLARPAPRAVQPISRARVPVPAPALVDTHDREPEDDKTRISPLGELRPPESPVEDEWYLAVDGHQFGPMSFDELCRRVRRGEGRSESGDEAFVWRDGFDDWIDAHSVPELRPFVPPPPPPRGRGSGLLPAVGGRSAAAAGLPVFREGQQPWPTPGPAPATQGAPGAASPSAHATPSPAAAGGRGRLRRTSEISEARVSEAFSLEALAEGGRAPAGSAGAPPEAAVYPGQQPMVVPLPALVPAGVLAAPAAARVSIWLKLGVVLSFLILLLGGSALVYLLFFDTRSDPATRDIARIGGEGLADPGAPEGPSADAGAAGAAGLEFAPVQVGRSRERPALGRAGTEGVARAPTETPKPPPRDPYEGLTPEQRRLLAIGGEDRPVALGQRDPSAARGPARDLTDREVQQVLAQFRGRIQSCYERASKRDYSLGELRVDATVDLGPSGRVRSVTLKGVESQILADCLRTTLRQFVFKPIGGDGQTLSVPLIFRGA